MKFLKIIASFLIYTLLFFAFVLYFLPKENLYYEAEHRLKPFDVVISDEKVSDKGFSLELSGADVYAMDGINVAHVERLNMMLLGFYNSVEIENIKLSSAAATLVPTEINRVSINYSVLNPLNITAYAVGDFGEADANVNLQERLARVTLTPSKLMRTRFKNTMKMLKKSKTGAYIYEYRF